MSQEEILILLKKNRGVYFSLKEIQDILKISKQSLCSNLNKLKDSNDVDTKEVRGAEGNIGVIRKLYKFKEKDDVIESILREFSILNNDERFEFTNADAIRQFMMIKYLKILGEKNGTKD